MPKPGDKLSTLFRSLGPDSGNHQAAGAAAQDAEQRWPLLKAMPPRRPEPPPALSADEKRRWSEPESVPAGERKPALSLPSLSSKLAKSLSKMSGRKAPEIIAPEAPVRAGQPAPAAARRAGPDAAPETPQSLFSALARVASDSDDADQASATGLFQNTAAQPAGAEREAPPAQDDSLDDIFSRLEGKQEAAAEMPARRPSFLDRWAKR